MDRKRLHFAVGGGWFARSSRSYVSVNELFLEFTVP